MKYILFSALLIGTILISGKIDINFHHNLNLPNINKSQITREFKYGFNFNNGLYKYQEVHIRLPDSIGGIKKFQDTAATLQYLTDKDTAIFHIAGYGGEVQTLYYLVSAIKQTKAKVVMIVESGAYSAHGYLALSGDELIIESTGFIMLHTHSMYGFECGNKIYRDGGTYPSRYPAYEPDALDRGITEEEACKNHYRAFNKIFYGYIEKLPYLTDADVKKLKDGDEVYIFQDTLKKWKGERL